MPARIVALAEGSAFAGTSHDRFGFLPFVVTAQANDQTEVGDTLTAAGLALGLTNSDINGNASHNIFRTSGGLDIIDSDAQAKSLPWPRAEETLEHPARSTLRRL